MPSKAKPSKPETPAAGPIRAAADALAADGAIAPLRPGRINLIEQSAFDEATKTAGADDTAIRDVAVLRPTSANNRVYPPEVIKRAAAKFEGARVFVDHRDPNSRFPQSVRNLGGQLKGVYFDEATNTLRAKELRLCGPAKAVIAECAKSAPDLVGLSIFAEGEAERGVGGKQVVREIESVESVDLVSRASSTKTLYEAQLTEGDVADSVAAKREDVRLQQICNAANDLINRTVWDYGSVKPMTHADRAKKIVGYLAEWQDILRQEFTLTEAAGAGSEGGVSDSPLIESTETTNMDFKDITLETLTKNRADLVEAISKPLTEKVAAAEARATEAESKLKLIEARDSARNTASKLLDEAKCPPALRTTVFIETLVKAGAETDMKALIEDRMAIAKVGGSTGSGAGAAERSPLVEAAVSGGEAATDKVDTGIDGLRSMFGVKPTKAA